jgi:hypothetical protein
VAEGCGSVGGFIIAARRREQPVQGRGDGVRSVSSPGCGLRRFQELVGCDRRGHGTDPVVLGSGFRGLTFNGNVAVTRNLAFVSTNQTLYAMSLATHELVWSWPSQGNFAISGSGTLYLVESTFPSKLVAFRLR